MVSADRNLAEAHPSKPYILGLKRQGLTAQEGVISYQVPPQALDSETGIGGPGLKKELDSD